MMETRLTAKGADQDDDVVVRLRVREICDRGKKKREGLDLGLG